jgi:hypothetical protein
MLSIIIQIQIGAICHGPEILDWSRYVLVSINLPPYSGDLFCGIWGKCPENYIWDIVFDISMTFSSVCIDHSWRV